MILFGVILGSLLFVPAVAGYLFHRQIMRKYLHHIVRIFQLRPLFIIPGGQPVSDAEEVHFPTTNGLTLSGCYLKAQGPRRGVILFGLEFGSNKWSCVPYCDYLRQNGFDIFAFEPRGQGDSPPLPGYEPMQWVTQYEVEDFLAAIAYLKERDDADPRGIGLFGISKGAGAGLTAAAEDPFVRCFVTDGVFATYTTMVPYMQKWITIYTNRMYILKYIPLWYYHLAARLGLRKIRRVLRVHFPPLERALPWLAPRPLLMIHGGGDTYIKPDMAKVLFEMASEPKELWLVAGAKHNQAFQLATEEYQSRVFDFFRQHLGKTPAEVVEKVAVSGNGALNGSRRVSRS